MLIWDKGITKSINFQDLHQELTPIRNVDYLTIINRLGESGQIDWVDRDATNPATLLAYGRIAIVGWMKSGKTREAAELINKSIKGSLFSQVFEIAPFINSISIDQIQKLIYATVDRNQKYLLFIDELGLNPDPEHLKRLSIVINEFVNDST